MDKPTPETLRRLHESMTPGEWIVLISGPRLDYHVNAATRAGVAWCLAPDDESRRPETEDNAQGIATLRNLLPQLIAMAEENERLREERDQARRERDEARGKVAREAIEELERMANVHVPGSAAVREMATLGYKSSAERLRDYFVEALASQEGSDGAASCPRGETLEGGDRPMTNLPTPDEGNVSVRETMNDEEKIQFGRDLYDASHQGAVDMARGRDRSVRAIKLRCLGCNGELWFPADSPEARGEFNPFCPNGECEDRFAATL